MLYKYFQYHCYPSKLIFVTYSMTITTFYFGFRRLSVIMNKTCNLTVQGHIIDTDL